VERTARAVLSRSRRSLISSEAALLPLETMRRRVAWLAQVAHCSTRCRLPRVLTGDCESGDRERQRNEAGFEASTLCLGKTPGQDGLAALLLLVHRDSPARLDGAAASALEQQRHSFCRYELLRRASNMFVVAESRRRRSSRPRASRESPRQPPRLSPGASDGGAETAQGPLREHEDAPVVGVKFL
jgi:hypothetical protein